MSYGSARHEACPPHQESVGRGDRARRSLRSTARRGISQGDARHGGPAAVSPPLVRPVVWPLVGGADGSGNRPFGQI